jgi:lysophospholipase L1-like esterase
MKRPFGLLVGGAGALLLVALGMSKSSAPPGGSSQAMPRRVLLVGDSLAVGLTAPLSRLAEQSQVAFRGSGLSGSNVRQWARGATLPELLSSFRPTHVLVSLGTNDAAGGGVDVATLGLLLSVIQGAGAVPLWVGPPRLPARLSADTVRSDIRRSGVRMFPSEEVDIAQASDGIHPTAEGYARWAAALWDWALSASTYAG